MLLKPEEIEKHSKGSFYLSLKMAVIIIPSSDKPKYLTDQTCWQEKPEDFRLCPLKNDFQWLFYLYKGLH